MPTMPHRDSVGPVEAGRLLRPIRQARSGGRYNYEARSTTLQVLFRMGGWGRVCNTPFAIRANAAGRGPFSAPGVSLSGPGSSPSTPRDTVRGCSSRHGRISLEASSPP